MDKVCSVVGCERPRKIREYCPGHGERVRKYGHPDATRPLRPNTKRRKSKRRDTYYWYLYMPEHPIAQRDGYIAEHRYLAYEQGWLTDPTNQEVHHKDHNGLNNALDNLIVMTSGEHRRQHTKEDGVQNQYGSFLARTDICTIDGCELKGASELYCVAHLTRFKRYGNPLAVKRVTKYTVEPYELIT